MPTHSTIRNTPNINGPQPLISPSPSNTRYPPSSSQKISAEPPPPYTPNATHSPTDNQFNFNLTTDLDSKTDGDDGADIFDATLPPWRAAIRRSLVRNIEWESKVLAKMQDFIRTPWLDAYFVYTSSLGTHIFFMTFLPALFFFGYDEIGRQLLVVLALGVYCSSFVKDLICSPRPFSPPVTRLTIGTHHLEYGFPSTHSANCVSIALFFFTRLHIFYSEGGGSGREGGNVYCMLVGVLLWYASSIVFGRLYTAMHSFTDCVVGVAMGAGIWWVHDGHWGLGAGVWVERIIEIHGVAVPLVVVPLCLIMVNQHPQPVDDCPCFEDAIAIVSVVMGSVLARWHAVHYGFDDQFFTGMMPGSAGKTWDEAVMWWVFAVLKMVVGIIVIFTWRILAKSMLHMLLPPTFRLLSQAFTLPHRRFYTPATDYGSVPSELGLRPIPSVMDLPGELGFGQESEKEGEASGVGREGGSVRVRTNGNGGAVFEKDANGVRGKNWELEKSEGGKDVKHYDADVLTKVIVYCGIAVLACEILPVMFEMLGWGVKSW